MELSEFLLARIAEDEKIGRLLQRSSLGSDGPVRVLAECEAKRRIIERASVAWDDSECTECNEQGYFADAVLKALALPYADHPDWCEAWRPDTQ